MKRLMLLAASTALAACSPAVWRPLQTTEAASDLQQVTRSHLNEFDPAVSPDAASIAYEVAASGDGPSYIEVMSLAAVSSGGPGAIQYTSGAVAGIEPTWMPDGSGLFFLSAKQRSRTLVEMIGNTSRETPFAAAASEVTFAGEWPAVSPDGSTVAMSIANTGVFHTNWRTTRHYEQALGFTDLRGGGGLKVSGEGTEPAWSPDGRRLAFVRSSGGHGHVFVANADGSLPQQITEGPSDDEQPAWAPDGRSIVFCSTNGTVDTRQADLFTVRPDGSGLVQLTEGDRYACHPTWGRDGFVYFHVNARERFHIWRLRPG